MQLLTIRTLFPLNELFDNLVSFPVSASTWPTNSMINAKML